MATVTGMNHLEFEFRPILYHNINCKQSAFHSSLRLLKIVGPSSSIILRGLKYLYHLFYHFDEPKVGTFAAGAHNVLLTGRPDYVQYCVYSIKFGSRHASLAPKAYVKSYLHEIIGVLVRSVTLFESCSVVPAVMVDVPHHTPTFIITAGACCHSESVIRHERNQRDTKLASVILYRSL